MQSGGSEFRTPGTSGNDAIASSLSRSTNPPSGGRRSTSSKEQYKKHISDRNFFEAFAVVVKDLNQLKVTTIIEDELEDANTQMIPTERNEGKPGKRMVTVIDLIDGDITNIIGSRFINDSSYGNLRQQHLEQVVKGQEIIKSNLKILQDAIDELIKIGQSMGKIPSDSNTKK